MLGKRTRHPKEVRIIYKSVFSKGARRLVQEVGHTDFTERGIRVFGPTVSAHCSRSGMIDRSRGSVQSAPVRSSKSVLLLTSSVSIINVSRTRFLSGKLIRIYGRLTGHNMHIVITKLSVSFGNIPFNPVPTLYTVTSRIAGIRTVYIGYNTLTCIDRQLITGSGHILLNRRSRCRPLYESYCRGTVDRRG